MVVPFVYTEEEYKKLEEERDFFKEQAILWRKDYKNEYEQNEKLSEENGQLKSDLAFKNTMLDNVSAEYESSQDVIKKLKEDNRFLTKISKEYMKKENIIEVAEFTELYKDDLEEENKELKERIRFLEQCLDNKEKVNKSLREENKRLSDFLECES